MTIGGVDTYYDYDEQQWKFRRLGGGPVRQRPAHLRRPQPTQPTQPTSAEPTPTELMPGEQGSGRPVPPVAPVSPEAADG
ncbi:hypothetical protein [Kribbella sp. NPDC048915]|uniref:hypothetical protein n=1 Tax=Kribbella sp. NPDC048915 TaxID=3155148 RepID=UPI0033CA8E04